MSVSVMREAYPEVRPATSGFRCGHKGIAAQRGTSPIANENISKINDLDLHLSALSVLGVLSARQTNLAEYAFGSCRSVRFFTCLGRMARARGNRTGRSQVRL